jgi:HD-GYP domain-containing protein (c-di-GMP phosphodiesterase class II)
VQGERGKAVTSVVSLGDNAIARLVRPLQRALQARTFADALRVTCDDLASMLGATSVSVTGPTSHGLEPDQAGMQLPLEGERTRLGTMIVGPREGRDPYGPDDRHLAELYSRILGRAMLIDELTTTVRGQRTRQRQRSAEVRQAQEETVRVLAAAVELRDGYTGGHLKRVAAYAITLHKLVAPGALVYEDAIGFTVHDIGKLGIPDAILLKPGPLDAGELRIMRKHPIIGAALIQNLPFLRGSVALVRHHHERWDGAGYPEGLRGENIPLSARVFAVADSYDAATTDRPYRLAMSPADAVKDIVGGAGSAYDPTVIQAFRYAVNRNLIAA